MTAVDSEILTGIVENLKSIPGMDQLEIRDTLIFSGFTIDERDLARQIRKVNMQADLEQIVDYANRLGKLDVLIDNAKRQAQSDENRKRLDRYKGVYQTLLPNRDSQIDVSEQTPLAKLLSTLTTHFSLEELHTLSFVLGVDFDDLPGEGKTSKARELLAYLRRRNRINELVQIIKRERFDPAFNQIAEVTQEAAGQSRKYVRATSVQVIILLGRDLKAFTLDEQNHFIIELSHILHINPEQVHILDVRHGSVLVTLEMPEDAARVLIAMYLTKDSVLDNLRIARVELQQSNTRRSSKDDASNQGPSKFDVFLAHNSRDKAQVKAVAMELKRRGLNPWLDEEQIPPGRWFQDVIQKAIPTVKSAAIFIGSEGLGKWQVVELRVFVSRCVDAGLPVIPVLLPSITEIPDDLLFLQELNYVRFEKGVDDVEALDRLQWGITGVPPLNT